MVTSSDRPLFPVFDGKAWGYIDERGQVVVAPAFTLAGAFSDGRGLVKTKAGWGYVDDRGEWVVAPRFVSAWPFSEGLAAVWEKVKGRRAPRCSFIDRAGRVAIDGDYSLALPFSCGRAVIGVVNVEASRRSSGLYHHLGYIDAMGTVIAPPRFALASAFSEGLASAQDPDTRKLGFLDTAGRWAIPPRYQSTAPFREGLLGVVTEDHQAIYLCRDGQEALRCPIPYRAIAPFSEGLAAFPSGERLEKGYMDRRGRVVIAPRSGLGASFSQGLAVIVDQSGAHGFIDRTGKVVIRSVLAHAEPFQGGLARVHPDARRPGASAYIDREGRWVWQPPRAFASLPTLRVE